MIKTYYHLTKPGIVYGNALSAIAGFFFAATYHPNFFLLIAMLVGTSLVIASACVFNNIIDKDIDAKMERTKKRAIVSGKIFQTNALVYGIILGLIGFTILYVYVNLLTTFIGFVGFFFYVVVYGYWKRHFVSGTLIGSISGSTPLVAGYCSVTNHFDYAALILFLIMAIWQMPHFYAIATYRKNDYAAAGLPVLPVVKGVKTAKQHIVFYIIVFALVSVSLTFFHYAGISYAIVMLAVSVYWLNKALNNKKGLDDIKWGRKVFGASLVVLLIFCLIISIQVLLP